MIKTIILRFNLLLLNPIAYSIVTILLILLVRLLFVFNIIPTVLAEGFDSETIRKIQDIYAERVSENPKQTAADIQAYNKQHAKDKEAYYVSNWQTFTEQQQQIILDNLHKFTSPRPILVPVPVAEPEPVPVAVPESVAVPVPETKSTLVENLSCSSSSVTDFKTERMLLEELKNKYAKLGFNTDITETDILLYEMQTHHRLPNQHLSVEEQVAIWEHNHKLTEPDNFNTSSSSNIDTTFKSTYTYTNLNEIYNTYGMEQSFGKETMNLIRLLSRIEKQFGVNPSSELTQAINNILPSIDTSNRDYEDLRLQLGGRYSKTISNLEILATNTNNPTLQKFIAQYNVNCYIYTQTKHGLQIYQETIDRIYITIIEKFNKK